MTPTYHYDKHGALIYEGDRVRCDDGTEGEVVWDDDCWKIDGKSMNAYGKDKIEKV